MVVKIINKWTDKYNLYTYGLDKDGTLYCKSNVDDVNLICVDPYFKKQNHYYYKFFNPLRKTFHYVKRLQ
jgi:hypothetical protein